MYSMTRKTLILSSLICNNLHLNLIPQPIQAGTNWIICYSRWPPTDVLHRALVGVVTPISMLSEVDIQQRSHPSFIVASLSQFHQFYPKLRRRFLSLNLLQPILNLSIIPEIRNWIDNHSRQRQA